VSLITIKLLAGFLSEEQKQQLIEGVTEAVVSVEGEVMRPLTWVLVEETIASGDWGIAGHGVTADELRAIRASWGQKADPLSRERR
jgi:4-oxalocrotonate tautomerase